MAKLTGPRVRGRKAGALRIAARSLAAQVKGTKGEKTETVEVRAANPDTKGDKGEHVEMTLPKGAVVVPIALTLGKTDANCRETIGNGAADVEVEVGISSVNIEFDDGTEAPLFYLTYKS